MRDGLVSMKEAQGRDTSMAGSTRSYSPTLRERLLGQKADLTQRLADVDSAIAALDSNPNFEEISNAINKVSY